MTKKSKTSKFARFMAAFLVITLMNSSMPVQFLVYAFDEQQAASADNTGGEIDVALSQSALYELDELDSMEGGVENSVDEDDYNDIDTEQGEDVEDEIDDDTDVVLDSDEDPDDDEDTDEYAEEDAEEDNDDEDAEEEDEAEHNLAGNMPGLPYPLEIINFDPFASSFWSSWSNGDPGGAHYWTAQGTHYAPIHRLPGTNHFYFRVSNNGQLVNALQNVNRTNNMIGVGLQPGTHPAGAGVQRIVISAIYIAHDFSTNATQIDLGMHQGGDIVIFGNGSNTLSVNGLGVRNASNSNTSLFFNDVDVNILLGGIALHNRVSLVLNGTTTIRQTGSTTVAVIDARAENGGTHIVMNGSSRIIGSNGVVVNAIPHTALPGSTLTMNDNSSITEARNRAVLAHSTVTLNNNASISGNLLSQTYGAIHVQGQSADITLNHNARLENNTLGINVDGIGRFTITSPDVTFANNNTGIRSTTGSLNFSGGTIDVPINGIGIDIHYGSISIDGGTVINGLGTATTGVQLNGGNFSLYNGSFAGITNIFIGNGGNINLRGGAIEFTQTLNIDGYNVLLSGTNISRASSLAAYHPIFNISNGGTLTVDGGNYFIHGSFASVSESGTFNLIDATIVDFNPNNVTTPNAIIDVSGSDAMFEMTNSTLTSSANRLVNVTDGAMFIMDNSRISYNEFNGLGPAVNVSNGEALVRNNSTITEMNHTSSGSVINVDGENASFNLTTNSSITSRDKRVANVTNGALLNIESGAKVSASVRAVSVIDVNNATLRLGSNGTISSPGGRSNGYVVNITGSEAIFYMDTQSDTGGILTNGGTIAGVSVKDGASFTMYSGNIEGNREAEHNLILETAVELLDFGSSFTMHGGRIHDFTHGIRTNNGDFEMHGGIIENTGLALQLNGALNGVVENQKLVMTGGYVRNNGTGVLVLNSNFTLSGGSIHQNISSGVVVAGRNAHFTMTGGSITNNIAENGGGIFWSNEVDLNNISISRDARVSNNTATQGTRIDDNLNLIHNIESNPAGRINPLGHEGTHRNHAFNNHDIRTINDVNLEIIMHEISFRGEHVRGTNPGGVTISLTWNLGGASGSYTTSPVQVPHGALVTISASAEGSARFYGDWITNLTPEDAMMPSDVLAFIANSDTELIRPYETTFNVITHNFSGDDTTATSAYFANSQVTTTAAEHLVNSNLRLSLDGFQVQNGLSLAIEHNQDNQAIFTMPAQDINLRAVWQGQAFIQRVDELGNYIDSRVNLGWLNVPADATSLFSEIEAQVVTGTIYQTEGFEFTHWSNPNGGSLYHPNANDLRDYEFTMTNNAPVVVYYHMQSLPFIVTIEHRSAENNALFATTSQTINFQRTGTIAATTIPGYSFANWQATTQGNIANVNASSTSFTLTTADDITLVVLYNPQDFAIRIEHRLYGETAYFAYSTETVRLNGSTALNALSHRGNEFIRWQVSSGNGTIENESAVNTSFTLTSAANATITAYYNPPENIVIDVDDNGVPSVTVPSPDVDYEVIDNEDGTYTVIIDPDHDYREIVVGLPDNGGWTYDREENPDGTVTITIRPNYIDIQIRHILQAGPRNGEVYTTTTHRLYFQQVYNFRYAAPHILGYGFDMLNLETSTIQATSDYANGQISLRLVTMPTSDTSLVFDTDYRAYANLSATIDTHGVTTSNIGGNGLVSQGGTGRWSASNNYNAYGNPIVVFDRTDSLSPQYNTINITTVDGWSYTVAGNNSLVGDIVVTFTPNIFEVTILHLDADNNKVHENTTVNIPFRGASNINAVLPIAANGYIFTHWYANGFGAIENETAINTSFTLTTPQNVTIIARYVAPGDIIVDIANDGTPSFNLPNVNWEADYVRDTDNIITITITPDEDNPYYSDLDVNLPLHGWEWDGDYSIDDDGNIIIVVTPIWVEVSFATGTTEHSSPSNPVTATVTADGGLPATHTLLHGENVKVLEGSDVSITYSLPYGYEELGQSYFIGANRQADFEAWVDALFNNVSSNSINNTVSTLTEDILFGSIFAAREFTITINHIINDEIYYTEAPRTLAFGSSITVIPRTDINGFEFDMFDSYLSNFDRLNNIFTLTSASNATIEVHYTAINFTITIQHIVNNDIHSYENITLAFGNSITVIPRTDITGFIFNNFAFDASDFSSLGNIFTLTAAANATIRLYYAAIQVVPPVTPPVVVPPGPGTPDPSPDVENPDIVLPGITPPTDGDGGDGDEGNAPDIGGPSPGSGGSDEGVVSAPEVPVQAPQAPIADALAQAPSAPQQGPANADDAGVPAQGPAAPAQAPSAPQQGPANAADAGVPAQGPAAPAQAPSAPQQGPANPATGDNHSSIALVISATGLGVAAAALVFAALRRKKDDVNTKTEA